MEEEDRVRGGVGVGLYASYLAAYGAPSLALIGLTLTVSVVGRTGVDWVLALWSTDALGAPLSLYVGAFVGTAVGSIAFTAANSMLFAQAGLAAAGSLHEAMLKRVLRAPLTFFDSTPVGRVLNRFTADVAVLDKDLPSAASSASGLLFRIVATLIVQAIILPWTLLGTIPLAVLYGLITLVFRSTARELKRLDLASKSLSAALLSECAGGQSTIAAYAAAGHFQEALGAAVDKNLLAYWASNSANRWLGLRLDWLGSLLLLVVILAAVLSPNASPGLVGLAITYSMAITGLLNWLVRSSTDMESLLSSAERVTHYANLPVEASPVSPPGACPPSWPGRGEVELRGVVARYRPGLPPCLNGVSLTIPAGSKVGIVGRTGSGKSSLLLALFRVLELEAGQILIDGIDIARLGLDDLRQRLSIVPQDATLFQGCLRTALDPLGQWGDEDLRGALARVGLPAASLDDKVEEGGQNFSMGQKQLLCLARALLRRSRVVVLDESTASIDTKADAALQATLRESLGDATVFVVAHRLNTILDADLVAVMEEGRLVECGPPKDLAAAAGGRFAALVRDYKRQQQGKSAESV